MLYLFNCSHKNKEVSRCLFLIASLTGRRGLVAFIRGRRLQHHDADAGNDAALDALCERRLPMRRNLAGVVAKSKAAWIETVMKTKAELA